MVTGASAAAFSRQSLGIFFQEFEVAKIGFRTGQFILNWSSIEPSIREVVKAWEILPGIRCRRQKSYLLFTWKVVSRTDCLSKHGKFQQNKQIERR